MESKQQQILKLKDELQKAQKQNDRIRLKLMIYRLEKENSNQ